MPKIRNKKTGKVVTLRKKKKAKPANFLERRRRKIKRLKKLSSNA